VGRKASSLTLVSNHGERMEPILSGRGQCFLVGVVKRHHDHQRRLQLRRRADAETQGVCSQIHKSIRHPRSLLVEEISRRRQNVDPLAAKVVCELKAAGFSMMAYVTRRGPDIRAWRGLLRKCL
jgi:hypothetical protein